MREALRFAIKAIVFTTIFWTFWLFVFKPISAYIAPGHSTSQASSTDSQEALMAKYWEQARLADEIQMKYLEQAKVTDQQQKRFDAQLQKQEQVFERFDALVKKWENQSSPSK